MKSTTIEGIVAAKRDALKPFAFVVKTEAGVLFRSVQHGFNMKHAMRRLTAQTGKSLKIVPLGT